MKPGDFVWHKKWSYPILLINWTGRWWEGLIDDEVDLFFEDELELINEIS
jgi:hypothetical protein